MVTAPNMSTSLLITLGLSLGVTLTSFIVFFNLRAKSKFRRAKNKSIIPKTWRHVGKIKHLYIYPLKSGHYIPLEKAFCDVQGMKHPVKDGFLFDRSFILFNEKEQKFISSKQFSHLLLLRTEYRGHGVFEFSVHDQPSYEKLTISISDVLKANVSKSFNLYADEVLAAFDCGDLASEWFSNYLIKSSDSNIRLGFNSNGKRSIGGNHMRKYTTVYENVNDEDLGVYTDMTSFMILNESSLTDLNDRMRQIGVPDVPMLQFRGNIIVDGPEPYAEDSWDWIRFNSDVVMRAVKPCTRCALVCVHPDTGHKQVDHQPLMMLRQYRAVPDERTKEVESHAPVFGLYVGAHRTGYVNVGDDVYVGVEE